MKTEDMNLSDAPSTCQKIEWAIRLLAWHVEQLVEGSESKID